MLEYIRSVKRGMRDQHGFKPTYGTDEDPNFDNIPDGKYPMTIDGKVDSVEIKGGKIFFCNFEEEVKTAT